MYIDTGLKEAIQNHSWLQAEPVIAAEFNLNLLDNIDTFGCYKYIRNGVLSSRWQPKDPLMIFSKTYNKDRFFEDWEDSDYQPIYNQQKKIDLYYNLEDCFKANRPRSGINKILYNPGNYVDTLRDADRPRYYWADASDRFKYWTSYRTWGSDNDETGISDEEGYIDNAVPFIVYKEPVYANRIVVKIQSGVGVQVVTKLEYDPLADPANSSLPEVWRIEYLDVNDVWQIALENPTVGNDGYVELGWSVVPPTGYEDSFELLGVATVSNPELLEDGLSNGQGWIIGDLLYIWNSERWVAGPLQFGFVQYTATEKLPSLTKIVDPTFVVQDNRVVFSEMTPIKGLRIVVEKMKNADKAFDLIELSPRLSVFLTDSVESYDITKTTGADDGAIPLAGLLVSNGSLSLFNGDGAFNKSNILNVTSSSATGSAIAKYLHPNTKIYFWEKITAHDRPRYIPIKIMYVEQWPDATSPSESLSLTLRDAFFLFEAEKTLDVLRRNMTLTGAIGWLLDSIGFSNYIFVGFGKHDDLIVDPIIPYFFANSDLNIAETLNELCRATQSMMFFDEYNNFVVLSKDYVFNRSRNTDFNFVGNTQDELLDGLANIEKISANTRQFFNNGSVKYTDRYIQRAPNSLSQMGQYDKYRKYVYQPVMLWQVTPSDNTKTQNAAVEKQTGYALSAVTLKEDIKNVVPTVVNGQVINNVIDIGESAYWLGRYDGYLYANNEIIHYDAIEFAVPEETPSLVWIENNEQYQYYFGNLPFKGRIFPSGRIRIFTEPFYDNGIIRNGPVKSHGRGCFQTDIVLHKADINDYWTKKEKKNTKVFATDSTFIFNEYAYNLAMYQQFSPDLSLSIADMDVTSANNSWSIDGKISNMWAEFYTKESGTIEKEEGAIQASALVFNGVTQSQRKLRDLTTSTTKLMDNANFVGSRVRIIGKEENGLGGVSGTPTGSFSYDFQPRQDSTVNLSGGSCGISMYLDREKNTGYFFEIVSFTADINNLINSETEYETRYIVAANTTDPILSTMLGVSKTFDDSVGPLYPGMYLYHDAFAGGQITEVNREFNIVYMNQNPSRPIQENEELIFGHKPDYNLYDPRNITVTSKASKLKAIICSDYIPEDIKEGTFVQHSKFPVGTNVLDIDEDKKIIFLNNSSTSNLENAEEIIFSEFPEPQAMAVHNMLFYKVVPGTHKVVDTSNVLGYSYVPKLVPIKLWGGLTQILIDQGIFVGQSRAAVDQQPTVYDLGIEHIQENNIHSFNLYINGKVIAQVQDTDPLDSGIAAQTIIDSGNYAGMFVRGSTHAMFENFMLISHNNYATQTSAALVFGDVFQNASESKMINYAISPFLHTSLSGKSISGYGDYTIDYEEFGTILRECAYFNVKYDQAYPAFYSAIAPNVNNSPAYYISNYRGGPYRAEFLIFNTTDKPVVLDETTGNYLRILGVTFTQQTERTYSINDYLEDIALRNVELFNQINSSRKMYGEKTFDFSSIYVQDRDSAQHMLEWLLNQTKDGKQQVEIDTFWVPTIQLGDIVTIGYEDSTGVYVDNTKQMIVREMKVSRDSDGPSMSISVVER